MVAKKHHFTIPQIIIFIIITAAMIAVIVSVVCIFLFKPENTVKAKISELSSDYYENYLYQSLDPNSLSSEEFSKSMQKYEKTGLTITTLRQILLYDHKKNAKDAPFLKKYCDEDSTYIKYYPEYPYSKTSYRTEYTYSCEF